MRGHLVDAVRQLDEVMAALSELDMSDEARHALSDKVFGAKFSVQSAIQSVNSMYLELVNVSGRKL